MHDQLKLSRRAVVAGVAISPTFPVSMASAATSWRDRELIALGREFDALTAAIDNAIEDKTEIGDLLERFGPVDAAITNTSAKTVEGLRVKARAACWALLGDLDPTGEPTTDRRMALSIVRDLIRLHDQNLEKPDALRNLAAHD